MLKKVLFGFLLVVSAIAIGSSKYSDSHTSVINNIADALKDNNIELAAQLCDKLYGNIQNCSVETLADLTVDYYTLSAVNSTNNDENETYSTMNKMLNCYISAMDKDPEAARECWHKIANERMNYGENINIPHIAESFRNQLYLHEVID